MDRRVRPAVVAFALLASCTGPSGDVAADYTLHLVPHIPVNESLFDTNPSISVVVRDATGTHVSYLGDMGSQALTGDAFGPLDDAMVGIAVEAPGGDEGSIDPTGLLAYGEAGPVTAGAGGDDLTLDFLLAQVGAVGQLDLLDADAASMFGSVAMLPDGRVFIFGGTDNMSRQGASGNSRVQMMDGLDTGDWQFHDVAALPDWDHDDQPDTMVGGTATVVDVDGSPMIFVAGGRPDYVPYGYNSYNAGLFDPTTHDWTWFKDDMIGSRSEHHAERLGDRVIVLGGISGGGANGGYILQANFELFDPSDHQFEAGQTLSNSAIGFATASLGTDGLLVCGGGRFTGTTTQYTDPESDCNVIGLDSSVRAVADLPEPDQLLAMAPLPDGRVLATGGLLVAADNSGDTFPATDKAWIYDPSGDAWTPVTSRMAKPRAMHKMIAMPDGRVLVVGGVEAGSFLSDRYDQPVECPELFDPATLEFTVASPCSTYGTGAFPMVASDPSVGAFVLSGPDDTNEGGREFGIVGFGPPS